VVRSFFAAIAVACILGTNAPAAPPPKETLYFPTKLGAKWVYVSAGGKKEVRSVTAVADKDGAKVVTVSVNGETRKYQVSEDGVFLVAYGKDKYDPPECLLKLPHADGAKWDLVPQKFGPQAGTFEAFGPERIEVPAGKYSAIRVESFAGIPNVGFFEKTWYAKGVGVVKFARSLQSPTRPEDEWVLKSFTAGR
jgi:hypothetical protein